MGGCASKKGVDVDEDQVEGARSGVNVPRALSCKVQSSGTDNGPLVKNAAKLAWQASARSLSLRMSRRRQASYRIRKTKNITFSPEVHAGESEEGGSRPTRRSAWKTQTGVTSLSKPAASGAANDVPGGAANSPSNVAAETPDGAADERQSGAELITHPSTRRRRCRTATDTSVDSVVHYVAAAFTAERAANGSLRTFREKGRVPDDLDDESDNDPEADLYEGPPMLPSFGGSDTSTAKQRWARGVAAARMFSRKGTSKAWLSTIGA